MMPPEDENYYSSFTDKKTDAQKLSNFPRSQQQLPRLDLRNPRDLVPVSLLHKTGTPPRGLAATRSFWILLRATSGLSISHKKQ